MESQTASSSVSEGRLASPRGSFGLDGPTAFLIPASSFSLLVPVCWYSTYKGNGNQENSLMITDKRWTNRQTAPGGESRDIQKRWRATYDSHVRTHDCRSRRARQLECHWLFLPPRPSEHEMLVLTCSARFLGKGRIKDKD